VAYFAFQFAIPIPLAVGLKDGLEHDAWNHVHPQASLQCIVRKSSENENYILQTVYKFHLVVHVDHLQEHSLGIRLKLVHPDTFVLTETHYRDG